MLQGLYTLLSCFFHRRRPLKAKVAPTCMEVQHASGDRQVPFSVFKGVRLMTCVVCFLSFLHLSYLRHRWNLTRPQLQPSGLSCKVGFLIDFPSNGEGWMIGNKHLHPLDMDLFPRTWNCRCLWVQMELFTSTHFHISSHTCRLIVVTCTKMMMILDEAPNSSGPV